MLKQVLQPSASYFDISDNRYPKAAGSPAVSCRCPFFAAGRAVAGGQHTSAPAFTRVSMISGTSLILAPETVVMTTERMPARLMHPIFSSVQSKEPGLRNQSCVSRMPSRESWYFRQPYPFRRMQTSSVRWNGLPRMAKGMSCSFKSASSRQKSG